MLQAVCVTILHLKTFGKKRSQGYLCHPEKQTVGSVVQLVRMPPCHGGGRGFESRPVRRKPRPD